jgi:hypothetical protein
MSKPHPLTTLLSRLVGRGNTVVLHMAIVEALDNDHLAALFFEQLTYWSDRADGDWVVKTDDDWFQELRLSKRQLNRIREVLTERGLIETAVRRSKFYDGQPVLHYRLNQNGIEQFLERIPRSDEMSFPESDKMSLLETTKSHLHSTTESTTEITAKNLSADADAHPLSGSSSKNTTKTRKAKTSRQDMATGTESAPPSAPAIPQIIEAWLKGSGVIDPKAYAKKAFRDGAAALLAAGVTPDDVLAFCHWRSQDKYLKSRGTPFGALLSDYKAWRASNPTYQAPKPLTPEQLRDREEYEEAERETARLLALPPVDDPNKIMDGIRIVNGKIIFEKPIEDIRRQFEESQDE